MTWIDYIIVGFLVLSTLASLIRGFIHEGLSLITWICAFFLANRYYSSLAIYFTSFKEKLVRNFIAMSLIFISTIVIGYMINCFVGSLVEKSVFSTTDRVLGLCFGAVRGILLVSVGVFVINVFTDFSRSPDWQQSKCIPHFLKIIRWIIDYMKNSSIFHIKDFFNKFNL
ncbi:putative membrane protein, required for colicin V production [secondary endosymbiont of Heteropsylla cubana]|uniref:Putative membrane protein, required for colicin V production n=1 Tax=secondary endosymbiont of Heteropsylla cubana TaxID=134287 RepID=J3VTW7_9ENTR|nr:CvpA family protein [secondary endosymbiont of Heteropsylla cubana]AFP85486.1 putative membrane protein, required for colicin V production [secondary endosymbiont of Heteropsylla cubana]